MIGWGKTEFVPLTLLHIESTVCRSRGRIATKEYVEYPVIVSAALTVSKFCEAIRSETAPSPYRDLDSYLKCPYPQT